MKHIKYWLRPAYWRWWVKQNAYSLGIDAGVNGITFNPYPACLMPLHHRLYAEGVHAGRCWAIVSPCDQKVKGIKKPAY